MPQFKCLIDQPIRPDDGDGDPDLSRSTGKPLLAGMIIEAAGTTREFNGLIWRAYGISWIKDHSPSTSYLLALDVAPAPLPSPVVSLPPFYFNHGPAINVFALPTAKSAVRGHLVTDPFNKYPIELSPSPLHIADGLGWRKIQSYYDSALLGGWIAECQVNAAGRPMIHWALHSEAVK